MADNPGLEAAGKLSGLEECDVSTTDGTILHVRAIRPNDASRLVDAHGQLSLTTVHRRFFTAHPTLSEDEVARFTNVDNVDRVALIALDGDSLVAVARYDRDPGTDEAEVAFVVVDAYQGRGLGTLLLEQLASAARHNGISTFTADVLLENAAMMRVFRGSGYPVTSSLSQGVFSIRFPIGREAADPSAQCGGPSTC